ncbi:hypothetical protein SNEBB_010101 [Seison nebaliae]|nr:hypothetical protein SNEBB_010101 [Seison nebaliae]
MAEEVPKVFFIESDVQVQKDRRDMIKRKLDSENFTTILMDEKLSIYEQRRNSQQEKRLSFTKKNNERLNSSVLRREQMAEEMRRQLGEKHQERLNEAKENRENHIKEIVEKTRRISSRIYKQRNNLEVQMEAKKHYLSDKLEKKMAEAEDRRHEHIQQKVSIKKKARPVLQQKN